ncbi:MAG TPA: hypothetical protein VD930_01395 [Gemmatimonadales bacterium]|nr:hypothetical protein [Gemmatimonadales bacterium]
MNLESINRDLRAGATRSLALLGTLAAGDAVWLAVRVNRPATPSQWVAVGASVVLGTVLVALTWSALRNLGTRLTEEGLTIQGPGKRMTLRWSDVVRVRCESYRIILERIGAPPATISLWHVRDPDEVHRAIRDLVPNRALQRT